MHPRTATWKPAWRVLYGIACVLAVCTTSLVLIVQLGWMHDAFVYPHRLLKRSIGDSHWLAVTTGFYDGLTFRGGNRVWNLGLTESEAESLRAGCKGTAAFYPIAAMRTPVIQVIAPRETQNLVGKKPGAWLDAEKSLPQGCVLGSEMDKNRNAGSQAVLLERVIQIYEWVD